MRDRKPSHATIVAYVALITALGGSAYAVSKVGTNDLRANAVTGAKVKNHSVGAEDLKRITVRRVRDEADPDGDGELIAKCKKDERLIGTASGWALTPRGNPPILSSSLVSGRALSVRGFTPVIPNRISGQVICLRR
jgi:hypothetical protein